MFDERHLPASATSAPLVPHLHSPTSTFRSPVTPLIPPSLSLSMVPVSTSGPDFRRGCPDMASTVQMVQIGRVRLSDIAPYEGALEEHYARGIKALSGSLTRHNAVVIELDSQDAAVVRCGLESSRMYFKAKALCGGDGSGNGISGSGNGRGSYIYRSGSLVEEDLSPPGMADVFKCLGKVARAALSAIARHLSLRSDVFNHLLDDTPLPSNKISSSLLIATHSSVSLENGKGPLEGGKSTKRAFERGLLTLIASDYPGIQVCDPNGRWYHADMGLAPGNLLLLTGRSLSHITAGLRPDALYRNVVDYFSGAMTAERTSLAFRLMPQSNATLDCSPIAAAGHVIPQSFVPITVSQFLDHLSAEEEEAVWGHHDHINESQNHLMKESSLRTVLSDPLSGTFLEDAMVVSCGHSFGGQLLKKVIEMGRCALCDSEIETGALVPNYALRAAATAVRSQDEKRPFYNSAIRKRWKENGDTTVNTDSVRQSKGVQYPFTVNEKVIIKGNRRTPEKYVGREAIITSQCLNGWYLLKIIDSVESVRLQYRSLQKLSSSKDDDDAVQAQQ